LDSFEKLAKVHSTSEITLEILMFYILEKNLLLKDLQITGIALYTR